MIIGKTEKKLINFFKLINFNLNIFFKKKIHEILQVYISFFSIICYFALYLISKSYAINFIIIVSLINIITMSLSGNARNISILFSDSSYSSKVINFRLLIATFIIYLIFFFYEFLAQHIKIESIYLFSIILLTTTFWVIEPIIAFNELNKFVIKPTNFFLAHFFTFLFFFCFFLYSKKQDFSFILFYALSIINLFYILNFFFLDKKKIKKNINKTIFKIFDYSYLSSISLVLSAFFIRFIVTKELDHDLAADVILGFSIANFPGSLISSFYGVKYLNKDIILPFIFKYIMLIYLLLLFISIIFLLTNLYPPYNNLILIIIFSVFSSFFIFFAQVFRIMHMSNSSFKYVFLKDIFFHLSLVLLIHIIFYLNFYFYLIYLIYSLFAFYIYSSIKFHDFKKI